MSTRVQYTQGYVMARRWKRAPKRVPKADTILLRIRRVGGRDIDLYLRPDEAVAIITVLAAETWEEMVQ